MFVGRTKSAESPYSMGHSREDPVKSSTQERVETRTRNTRLVQGARIAGRLELKS